MKKEKRQLKKGITKTIIYFMILFIPFTLINIFTLLIQFILLLLLYYKGNKKVLYRY